MNFPTFRLRGFTQDFNQTDSSQDVTESVEETYIAMSWRVVPFLLAIVGLALVSLLFGRSIVSQVSGLYALASSPNAYLQSSNVALLYVATPIAVLSSFVLFLLPGILLTLALGQAKRVETLVLFSFGYSVALTLVVSTIAKLAFGLPMAAPVFMGLWLGTSLLSAALMAYRIRNGAVLAWPVSERSDIRRVAWMAGVVLVGTALLLPKLFWEDFNLDGIEAFEFGRSLTNGFLPNWEIQRGAFGFYQNFWLFALPNHWFITLLGPVEASARLPFLLYLPILFAVIALLIEHASPRKLSGIEEGVLWLGLALYTVVQTYNTNYEPFFADLAEMAATDTLGIMTFLATIYALWSGRKPWFAAFALMTYFAAPGGLLLIGLLAGFTFLSGSPKRWEHLKVLVIVIGVAVVIGIAYERIYSPLVLEATINQFSAINLAGRLFPPNLTEFVRFNALFFTTGLLPAISLFFVRRDNWQAWTLAGITAAYFLFIYVQVWTSLHQFTPVMILPLIVFWRLYLKSEFRWKKWLVPALAATTVLSLVLSFPQHFQISTAVKEFGLAADYRIGDYQNDYSSAAVNARNGLWPLIDSSYRLYYPNQTWGTDEFSWLYYAGQDKSGATELNYIVQPSSEPHPPDFTRVNSEDGVSVYVRDEKLWEQHIKNGFPQVAASQLYEPILRDTYRFFLDYHEAYQRQQNQDSQP